LQSIYLPEKQLPRGSGGVQTDQVAVRIQVHQSVKTNRNFGVDHRIYYQDRAIGWLLNLSGRPVKPGFILLKQVKQHFTVNHDSSAHGSFLVNAIISSVVIFTVARPRKASTTALPLDAPPTTGRSMTVLPSTTNSTSVLGSNPIFLHMAPGMVICPLLVILIQFPPS